jgi:hypothetical protein
VSGTFVFSSNLALLERLLLTWGIAQRLARMLHDFLQRCK